jgi:hypothetical protein
MLALVCLLGLSEVAAAESSLRGARVVWVRGDRIYVASPDSVALEAGTILTFKDHGKKVAAGEVTDVHDGELIAAKLTSGSLAKVKRLEKLEVASEPPVFRSPPVLRIGYPAPGRKNYLFDCRGQVLGFSLRHSIYQLPVDSMVTTGPTYRLLRENRPSTSPWPDTLLIRLFDDSADEEIALERGDLDVAVFWPGEASAHIREVTGWTRPSGEVGARGRLTATARQTGAADTLRDWEQGALERLGRELFRGDLLPAPGWTAQSTSSARGRFQVDASLPGRDAVEQFLNRATWPGPPVDTTRVVQLYYKETWRPAPAGPPEECSLLVRCPVISMPKLRTYLNAISIEALDNLFDCLPPATAKP